LSGGNPVGAVRPGEGIKHPGTRAGGGAVRGVTFIPAQRGRMIRNCDREPWVPVPARRCRPIAGFCPSQRARACIRTQRTRRHDMSVLPRRTNELIDFCVSRIATWTTNAEQIGIETSQVQALNALTTQASSALDASVKARNTAKAATLTLDNRIADLRDSAATIVRQIKAFADAQNNPPSVYALAQITPPAPPAPLPPPGKPEDFNVTLNSDGSVTLSWIGQGSAASRGTFYTVYRRLPGQSGYASIGGSPGTTTERRRASFTDATVPASAASAGVNYIVQGFRGTRAGPSSDALVVQFGADGSATLRLSDDQDTRLAA
jgi:hypothetical protein